MAARTLERAAGALSLVAGGVHGALSPAHFAVWAGYGAFFLVAATAQVLFGLALVLDAVDERGFGAKAGQARRALYAAGVVGNVALLGLYFWTRAVGVPSGPDAGIVSAVAPVDVVATAAEAALVAVLLAILARRA